MSGHAADPDTIAGTSLPNTRNAAVVPGKRAAAAMLAINRATERTVERINLEAMEQSFPDFLESEEDRQFVKLLTEKTVEHLKAGFKASWEDFFNNSAFSNFVAKSNDVDNVFHQARMRLERREQPQDAWKYGADPEIALAASLIPKLQGHVDFLRSTSTELSEQSDKRLKAIMEKQAESEATEREIENMLGSLREGAQNMAAIDHEAIRQLSESITPLISPDKL